jgi:hypothetical protein
VWVSHFACHPLNPKPILPRVCMMKWNGCCEINEAFR